MAGQARPDPTWSTLMTTPEKSTHNAEAAVTNPGSSPSLENYFRETLENIRRRLPKAASELKAAGVKVVEIDYDGCGDDGQIESIVYRGSDGSPVNPAGKVSLSDDALMSLFYDLL